MNNRKSVVKGGRLVAEMTFMGEKHEIYMKKVDDQFGLFVMNDGREEQVDDTEFQDTEQEALDEMFWNYGADAYDITWYE